MQTSISQDSSTTLCSFCGHQDNKDHGCRSQAFNLLNRLVQDNKDDPFSEVENLVFQGGGVKGIAYVGAVRELFDRYKLNTHLKRVAGSSSGSMAALYTCLDLSTEAMEGYMMADLLAKLESTPTVTVEGETFSLREVLDKALDFEGNYTKQDIVTLLKDVIGNLLNESLSWWQGPIASLFASGTIADAVGGFLAPTDDHKKTIRQRLQELESQIRKEEEEHNPHQIQQDQPKKGIFGGWFDKPTLDTKSVFHKAISQVAYQTFLAKESLFPNGWFPGNQLKEDLIKKPIEEGYKLKSLAVPDVDKLTFADMASATVDGKPAFKKLYVTAFNTITKRTEVFSVDHTPNAVVVDAVRASISIPVFFESVIIREKNVTNNTYPPRKMYTSEDKWAVIRYLDGGLLDNYPIWIFDDLQYCLGDNTAMSKTWKSDKRIDIRNPFTLGVKLLDSEQRRQFLSPYVDKQRLRPKALNLPEDVSVGGLLFTYIIAKSEDNQHIQRYYGSRTIYVDNLGVTTISFKLSPAEKKDLQKSGELAVRQYLNYAKWGKLSEIGQNYYPMQRSTNV